MTRVSIRLGGGGGERARWPLQSTVAPEVRTTGSQRRTSAARKAPNAAGVVPRDPTPTSAMPRRTSALSRSATFGGVRAGGRQQRLPRRHLEGRRAGLDDGRHLGEVGVALPACDAEPAQRAAAKVLRDRRQVVEHGLGPAAEQVGHRRRRAAVGDVRHGRAREHLEQLARQVPDAAATGRAEADRSTDGDENAAAAEQEHIGEPSSQQNEAGNDQRQEQRPAASVPGGRGHRRPHPSGTRRGRARRPAGGDGRDLPPSGTDEVPPDGPTDHADPRVPRGQATTRRPGGRRAARSPAGCGRSAGASTPAFAGRTHRASGSERCRGCWPRSCRRRPGC